MPQKQLIELFEEFISESQFVRRIRPETIKGYRLCFETLLKVVPGISLNTLTPETLTNFFKLLHERKRVVGKGEIRSGIKKSTQASYWSKLSAFFTWLEQRKHITRNPFRAMRCPTPSYEDRKFLQRTQIEKILAALHQHRSGTLVFKRNLVIFYLFLYCGLRKEELMYLQLGDVDFEHKVLTVRAETSKSGKSRKVPLHPTVILHLKEYLAEREHCKTPYLVVSSQRDDRFSYEGLKHLVERIKKVSGVNFHLHQFRHTFAVNFLKASKDLSKLKQLLGHSDIKMTAIYLRNLPVDEMRHDVATMNIHEFI